MPQALIATIMLTPRSRQMRGDVIWRSELGEPLGAWTQHWSGAGGGRGAAAQGERRARRTHRLDGHAVFPRAGGVLNLAAF
ncbi:MAG: hypothetical protein J7551_09270 [Chloroflexi bacterium]|nr:hypothetical protein [Chloroflexota bacterium]